MNFDHSADLDDVFVEIGEFGPHQMVTLFLLVVLNMLSASSAVNFMISANKLDYRCKVPECEFGVNNRDIPYNQSWLRNAIPLKDGKLDMCSRYAPKNWITSECSADMFDVTTKISCTEYIHASDERNLQTEFNIHCEENYKLALVGTIGNIARFIFLPITGLLSDRYGRLPGIIFSTQLAFILAMAKSFSINYYMYIVLEFLEASAFTFLFTGIFVFTVELQSTRYRVLGSILISIAYAVGEMALGLAAMYVHEFRILMRIFYIPGLFVFVCIWLVPESVRWLLATGRIDRAIRTLKQIARFNRRELSEKTIEAIKLRYSTELPAEKRSTEIHDENHTMFQLLCTIFKSKRLLLRFLSCCYQWAACTFSYYGLSQSSTQIAGANPYVSFIVVMSIEIPGNLLAQLLLNRMKRRILLFVAFILAALSIIATQFIAKEYSWLVLLCFVIGKGSITIAFTTLSLYTAEQWPTSIRNTIMNTCSMIGRTGSMLAPFAAILGADFGSLSVVLFSGSAIIAAISMLFNPETYSKKLPDTIKEAKHL